MTPPGVLRAGLAVVVTMLLGACGIPAAMKQEAVAAQIEAFLVAVRDGSRGSGWDLLRADVKAAYPGGEAGWLRRIDRGVAARLTWGAIVVDQVDDGVGCGRVRIGLPPAKVPEALHDDELPPPARVANLTDTGEWYLCASIASGSGSGVHGVG